MHFTGFGLGGKRAIKMNARDIKVFIALAFACAVFLPLTIYLIILVVVSFGDDALKVSGIIMSLLMFLATMCAAYAAWQSAQVATRSHDLAIKQAVRNSTLVVIAWAEEVAHFMPEAGYALATDPGCYLEDINHINAKNVFNQTVECKDISYDFGPQGALFRKKIRLVEHVLLMLITGGFSKKFPRIEMELDYSGIPHEKDGTHCLYAISKDMTALAVKLRQDLQLVP